MDTSKLTIGDKIILGSGGALLIFSFLPWFTYDFGPLSGSVTQNGWDYFFTGIVPVILGLVMIGFVISTKMAEVELPDMPVEHVHLLLGLGIAACALVVLRLLMGGDDNGFDVLDRSYGLLLAALAAIGLMVGAIFNFKEEGGQIPGLGGGSSSSGDSGTQTPF